MTVLLCYNLIISRPLRIEYPSAFYHITSMGNAKQKIFLDQSDCKTFLILLKEITQRYSWRIYAYCLMPNHYHLLIETIDANLSARMRQLNSVYTQRFNRRHSTVGHVFQGRFKAILIDKESYLLELVRYIILNPVRAKIVKDPHKWTWSSLRELLNPDTKQHIVCTYWILSQFGKSKNSSIKGLKEFLSDGMKAESPWKDLKGGIFSGDKKTLQKITSKYVSKDKFGNQAIPQKQLYAHRPSLKTIFSNTDNDRDVNIFKAQAEYKYALCEIGDYLGIHYSTASKAYRRGEEKLKIKT